ncbi:hypothetical protein K4L44_09100 [Halosquirtibacter laminarini]|uniref:Uncharacterized protein n=1 Tax=Halosquirtibacter laminarini TaxID=3374600 RepID=A0AC61NBB4_9BACT|nr:hypothetical protein K4L44_09100 [Prolixibacteraceae bacterium]
MNSRPFIISAIHEQALIIHIMYRWLVALFSSVVEGLDKESRIKKFTFRVINIVAKFTTSGRQQIMHLSTSNLRLIHLTHQT